MTKVHYMLSVGAALALLAAGSPAFASGGPTGGSNSSSSQGIEAESTTTLEITSVQLISGSTSTTPPTGPELEVTVSDLVLPSSTAHGPAGNYTLTATLTNGSNHSISLNQAPPPTSITSSSSTTETFYFNLPAIPNGSWSNASFANDTLTVNEVQGTGPKAQTVASGSTTFPSSGLPVGQTPEVPWAAGIPLVALGIAGFLFYRQRATELSMQKAVAR
ncbi:MAG: hypothetical protein OWU84_10310 [Firmicutes bacterium]|nr:hypothetical protein [Bacillota bacterium]